MLTILTLTAGLGGFLIPDTFMPARARVWILTGSDISIDHSVGGVDRRITTAVITPPYRGGEVLYAVVETSVGDTRKEDEGALVATAFTSLLDRNITVVGDACIGYETDPERSSADEGSSADGEISRGELHFSVYLCKYGERGLQLHKHLFESAFHCIQYWTDSHTRRVGQGDCPAPHPPSSAGESC